MPLLPGTWREDRGSVEAFLEGGFETVVVAMVGSALRGEGCADEAEEICELAEFEAADRKVEVVLDGGADDDGSAGNSIWG